MKGIAVVLVFMCVIAPVYGGQEVTLKELPPLQPLHWCQDSSGHAAGQIDPCGPGTTEVSSTMVRKPDGTTTFLPLQKEPATDTADSSAASDSASIVDQNSDVRKSPLGDFWRRVGKWLAFAIAVGLLAKFLKRSFILWVILGFVLRAILVALNVMAF